MELIHHILSNNNIEWSDLTKRYVDDHVAKQRIVSTDTFISDILIFIRVYSRLLITHATQEMRVKNSELLVIPTGSQDITSDYDVMLIGPGSDLLIKHIFTMFNTVHPQGDLSTFADTNFYPTPWFLPNDNQPRWIRTNAVTGKMDGRTVSCSVPLHKKFSKVERQYVFENFQEICEHVVQQSVKIKKSTTRKYKKLLQITKILNNFYYGSGTMTEHEYWDLLFGAQQTSVEAFTSTSAIAFVVLRLQKQLLVKLPTYNMETIIIELICQLLQHKGMNVQKHKHNILFDFIDVGDTYLFTTAKYVYRIQEVLKEILKPTCDRSVWMSTLPLYISKQKQNSSPEQVEQYKVLLVVFAYKLTKYWTKTFFVPLKDG